MAEKKRQSATTAPSAHTHHPRRIQNFLVVWLDTSIDQVKNEDCRKTIAKLNEIVKDVNTFTDVDECVHFIRSVKEEKAFLISSGAFGQRIASAVHDMSQVSTIYIFCGNKSRHEQWAKDWSKVGGVFTEIKPICEALKKATLMCDQNSIAISFVAPTAGATGQGLDQLDPTFMYTQILKEILLSIDFDQSHIKDFIESSRALLAGDIHELKNVDKLEREYDKHSPIWWYTYQSFLYSTLNRALRLMEVDLIVSMGFFVRHLHEYIATLYAEQFGGQASSAKFTVFRGQGLAQTAFDQLVKMKGGLLSFNNFLSTSTDRKVSFGFARDSMKTSDLVGILFILNIDPAIPSTPFANVRDVSYIPGENEILFSMHSVFRIGDIKQVDGNSRLWEIGLTLTSDNDPQLRVLTDRIREENTGSTGWHRLGDLMITLGQFSQAEKLYEVLLKQATTERGKAFLYYQLGWSKKGQGKYAEAITFYEKSIDIYEKILSPTDPELATSYNNIGLVYKNMGDYSKALEYYEKALTIRQKSLPPNHPSLATSYNNIGMVYNNMEEYSKGLEYYEKALAIKQKTLPPNHPDLATSYNNIGLVYKNMGEYSKALEYYEKDLAICQKTLPPNHPDLATSYNNIGLVYDNMCEYSKALEYYEKALAILQKTLPPSHPNLASSYNNIGGLYYNMNNYSKALSFLERALDIRQHVLPANHQNIRNTKEWIKIVKKKL